ncbi:T9SS type A sorting domain-containing protein, partial [Hymenobacter persicinus]
TPYAEAGGGGAAGPAYSLNFSATDQVPPVPQVAGAQAGQPAGAEWLVYPNPSSDGRFFLRLPAAGRGEISYTLLSALGTRVAAGKWLTKEQTPELPLDFSRLLPAPGVYLLLLEGPGFSQRLRLLRE